MMVSNEYIVRVVADGVIRNHWAADTAKKLRKAGVPDADLHSVVRRAQEGIALGRRRRRGDATGDDAHAGDHSDDHDGGTKCDLLNTAIEFGRSKFLRRSLNYAAVMVTLFVGAFAPVIVLFLNIAPLYAVPVSLGVLALGLHLAIKPNRWQFVTAGYSVPCRHCGRDLGDTLRLFGVQCPGCGKAVRCPTCDYDLTGTIEARSTTCPECGRGVLGDSATA